METILIRESTWNRYKYFTSLVEIQPKKIWVDCACGEGSGSLYILKHYQPKILFCIDISKNCIQETKQKTNGYINTCRYIRKNIIHLNKIRSGCDYFVCSETLEHIEKHNNQKVSKSITNNVKIGGHLFITVPGNIDTAFITSEQTKHHQFLSHDKIVQIFPNFKMVTIGKFSKAKKELRNTHYNSVYVLKRLF
jgi:2-polyprenyl-3-methyl-5-hydroxy-6-metoxy-1,4-benzoquinol methylase